MAKLILRSLKCAVLFKSWKNLHNLYIAIIISRKILVYNYTRSQQDRIAFFTQEHSKTIVKVFKTVLLNGGYDFDMMLVPFMKGVFSMILSQVIFFTAFVIIFVSQCTIKEDRSFKCWVQTSCGSILISTIILQAGCVELEAYFVWFLNIFLSTAKPWNLLLVF